MLNEIIGKDYEVKAKAIKEAFFDYLKWLEICPITVNLGSVGNGEATRRVIKWDKVEDDTEAIKMISRVAIFLSRIRGNTYAYETRSGAKLSNELDNSNGSSITEAVSYEYSYVARAHAFEIHGRNFVTKEDLQIIIKIALSTANRTRVSIIKLQLLTTMRRADSGGNYEHKRQFFTRDLIETLNISKSTARRAMKELEVLGLVRIGKEIRNGGENYYIELLEKFSWLLEKEFQDLIQGLDWE